jgi:hypothetical protein
MRLRVILLTAPLVLPCGAGPAASPSSRHHPTVRLPAPRLAQDTAQGVTRAGVTMPLQVQVDGQELVLNGVAVRKKFIVNVYVAGLYLPSKQSSAEQILAADEPRRLVMQFVHDVDKEKLCNAWEEALENNTPEALPELKAQFQTFCGFMDDVKNGERFVFTYLPGKGTVVEVRGNDKGTIEGKAFADALFKSWIGPRPGPGAGFKRALLGVSS